MRTTYKYRLYPTPAQRAVLQETLDVCCDVYNRILGERKSRWEQKREGMSLYDTMKMLPEWKREDSRLRAVYAQVLQEVCIRVDLAFKNFFRRCQSGEKPGYPQLKEKGHYKSFTYPQYGFKLQRGRRHPSYLRLSKIGDIKITLHRYIEGNVKTLTIKRDGLGNWWACFSCEANFEPLPPIYNTVGIDFGLDHLAVLSTGEFISNPRYFRKDEKDLAKARHRMSKCEKGTSEYKRYKRRVQHIHKRIVNRRRDFAHKLSKQLVDRFQVIAFENLSIRNMQAINHCGLNKSIADAAWGQIAQCIMYKAERVGRTAIAVDPRNTSQACSGCGEIVSKDLSVRVHSCPNCGLILDRDHNAALNILARGLAGLGENP